MTAGRFEDMHSDECFDGDFASMCVAGMRNLGVAHHGSGPVYAFLVDYK